MPLSAKGMFGLPLLVIFSFLCMARGADLNTLYTGLSLGNACNPLAFSPSMFPASAFSQNKPASICRTSPVLLFRKGFLQNTSPMFRLAGADAEAPILEHHGSRSGRAANGLFSLNMLRRETTPPVVNSVGHKVLVLNSSYEPLSVVSASRALSLIWNNKALEVVPHSKKWTSCSGVQVDVPSVVCLRRYVKVRSKFPCVNRRTVLMRDDGICQYCGKLAENIDHVIPRCRGGQNVWHNVVASCAPCNNKKADKMLKDTDMKLRKQPNMPSPVSWVHAAVWKVDPRWKPFVGDTTWQDIEKMWKGTKLDKDRQRKSSRSTRKKSSAALTPPKPAARKASPPKQPDQAEVDQIVGAYSPHQQE